MQRWLALAGGLPLFAAAATNAQPPRPAQIRHVSPSGENHRTIALRLTQNPGFNQLAPAAAGLAADTEVAPNARFGFHLMTISPPPLGPQWRTDGRLPRSRRPAISFVLKF
jgi:hypothetical protein